MKKIFFIIIAACMGNYAMAQPVNRAQNIFPKGTVFISNVPYAGDTLRAHLLDVYLPPVVKASYPVVVWVHGGAWMLNDKYSDMSYMANTVKEFIDKGYAVASIDYRYSTTAPFPAQIQDCNRALEFLYQNAAKYKLDRDNIALIGFSAGGHLASLLGLSGNNNIKDFYYNGKKPDFKIKLVLDFYGPSDLLSIKGNESADVNNPVNLLLGALVTDRPDLASKASPVTYVDKNDPPFLIVQGEKDESVNYTQSVSLSLHLKLAGVKNELMIVPNAPHYGVMFDAENIRNRIFYYLDEYLK